MEYCPKGRRVLRNWMKAFFVLVLMQGGVAAGLVFFVGSASATRLDAEACEALRGQRAKMVHAGVGQTLDKEAQWAAQHLDDKQLAEVATFLHVMEQIRFRCAEAKQDAKSKFGLQGNVPLPVRNMRRLPKMKSAQNNSLENSDKVNKEQNKAVISAITGEGVHKTKGSLRSAIAN